MTLLPSKAWGSYDAAIKSLGQLRPAGTEADVPFLLQLGIVLREDPPRLSELGRRYFDARFIHGDEAATTQALQDALLLFPPVIAVAQILDGVAGATRSSVESVLRSQGFGEGLTDRKIGSLLALMDRAGIIRYTRGTGGIEVLTHIATAAEVPSSVFISPDTPFGNRVWLRRVLEEGGGTLRWLDKHFTSAAFEVLWEAIDGHKFREVRILSLHLVDIHDGRKVKRDYGNLVAELANRGVRLAWRVIESTKIRDTHDRWVITDTTARNIPNVNAIFSGQHSELNQSEQRDALETLFESYWQQAEDIAAVWGGGQPN